MSAGTIDHAAAVEIAARRLSVVSAENDPLALVSRLQLELDPWQRRLLRSRSQQILLNVTRQGGKSSTSALLALATILAKGNQLVLIISPGERQSKLLFRTLLRFYEELHRPKAARAVNTLSLELKNGSQVYALPGDEGTIRGFAGVNLILIDEAARVADAMMAAIRPMLATSAGRIVAMSTPWGKRGWWYEAWVNGGDDWERYEIPATSCPRISSDFLERERRALPRLWFESEYLCQFVEPDDALFSYDSIARAFDPSVQPLWAATPGWGAAFELPESA